MTDSMDQPIYRFMNLYELFELAVNNRLKFTKLGLMEDKNEGLGEILKLQSGTWGSPLRNDRARLKQAHESHRESIYISSWTMVPDAMAMWLLYSKEGSAFRVKTSQTKLHALLDESKSTRFGDHHLLDKGHPVPILQELSPVEYVDFNFVHQKSKAKLEAFDRDLADAHALGDAGRETFAAILRDPTATQIEELQRSSHLKDIAYAHEHEVRASFHLRIRNAMTLEERRQLPDTIANVLGSPMLDVADVQNSPPVVTLPAPSDFIEEICFDSRMAHHFQTTIRQIISRDDLPYIVTKVFGSMIDEHDLSVHELDYYPSQRINRTMKGGLLGS